MVIFRQALEKMLNVYTNNSALGDPESIKGQLEENAKKLDKSNEELHKYQVSWCKRNTFGNNLGKVEGCSSSLLAAGRAELRRTQLTRSSRRHIEGAAGCRLTTQCYGAQLRWKGWPSIYLDPQSTLSTFQVGGNRSTRRKPTTFGRTLTNSSHMSVASPNRDSNPRSQRWKALVGVAII